MLIDDNDVTLPSPRKYISFDPTIHAGHIFIIITVLISTTTAWCTTQSRLTLLESYNQQRKIDTDTLAAIESDHHKELVKQIGDLQQDVTLILAKAR